MGFHHPIIFLPMPHTKFLVRSIIVGFVVFASWPARTHSPELHGFALVVFDEPFLAPDFNLPSLDGYERKLSDYRGGFVLLNFWATWCPPCLEEMPSMQVIHERYQSHGFQVVAVSSDEEGAPLVSEFVDKVGVNFAVLLDTDQSVSTIYGASNLPISFVLNADGEVIAAAQGARDWASDEALSTLDEMIIAP